MGPLWRSGHIAKRGLVLRVAATFANPGGGLVNATLTAAADGWRPLIRQMEYCWPFGASFVNGQTASFGLAQEGSSVA